MLPMIQVAGFAPECQVSCSRPKRKFINFLFESFPILAGFAPESLAGFTLELVADFGPELVAGFSPE